MSSLKETWTTWDRAWDNYLSTNERLELLQKGCIPGFVYTNPDTKIGADRKKLAEFISFTLRELRGSGNIAQVKHIQWKENHSQSALQWDMMNTATNEAFMSGWSYAKYDESGKLTCVADFW